MGKNETVKLHFVENFALSGTAAVISKTTAAPIERVKLMLQNQDEMIKSGRLKTPYTGVVDVSRRILAEEGLVHFWRGNFANCLRYFPTQALNFAFKDSIKAQFKPTKADGKILGASKNIAAGGLAGVLSLCFVYPLDFARTRLAADNKSKGGERQFKGLGDVLAKTVKSDGVHGLYRGFVISAVGIFFYRGCYFGFFDTLSPLLGKDAGFVSKFALGYAVTVCAGLVSYPIDTVRRRMMMTSGAAVKYNGSIDCARKVLAGEGIGSFFKGAGANILRGAAGAGVLAGFDVFKAWYISKRYA